MLTIKTEIDGVVHIREAEHFVFHKPGSDNFKLALKLAAQCKVADPSCIEWTPTSYRDPEMTEVYEEEELDCWHRNIAPEGELIGVLVTSLNNREIKEMCGSEITFVYPNDHIYVTNEQGKTVFSL
ncbi:TPA: hypothetical protein QB650_000460 [Pasteurella multocida]|uniref:hypothetical protein n=1 Tax=Pasteurella multocida TaxID=747 RepID=UPI0007ECF136|nr:hypothetical protein [Pasteurella multocida]MCL7822616.1 hypothetical protein [Pasteurella multocida]MCL7830807.1 hypothetical protein [Pasteurella multocida]OBP35901.1 hypothetical protein A0R74_02510 [Pasteurella multocida subsp. multocida]URH97341.1 hypothetical protein M8854_05340 [Pasteurella multocida]HDR1312793.1 hypothetical protein [Pasteurella multocida]